MNIDCFLHGRTCSESYESTTMFYILIILDERESNKLNGYLQESILKSDGFDIQQDDLVN